MWVPNFVRPNLHTCVFEFAVKLHVADFIDKKIAGKDSRNFFVIEKQSSEEEMQPIKKNFLRKAIPLFFHLALHAFPDIGLVGWIEKKRN